LAIGCPVEARPGTCYTPSYQNIPPRPLSNTAHPQQAP
jgi:hypothetical protein